MFGRPPRLAIDAVFGLNRQKVSGASPADYMNQFETNLRAYRTTNKEAARTGHKAKRYCDRRVKEAKLLPGDRVFVKSIVLKGNNKIADIWIEHVYVIRKQSDSSIQVFRVQRMDGKSGVKTLHRKHLLPMHHMPIVSSGSSDDGAVDQEVLSESSMVETLSSDPSDSSETDSGQTAYRPPQRRRPGETGVTPRRSRRLRHLSPLHQDSLANSQRLYL